MLSLRLKISQVLTPVVIVLLIGYNKILYYGEFIYEVLGIEKTENYGSTLEMTVLVLFIVNLVITISLMTNKASLKLGLVWSFASIIAFLVFLMSVNLPTLLTLVLMLALVLLMTKLQEFI